MNCTKCKIALMQYQHEYCDICRNNRLIEVAQEFSIICHKHLFSLKSLPDDELKARILKDLEENENKLKELNNG